MIIILFSLVGLFLLISSIWAGVYELLGYPKDKYPIVTVSPDPALYAYKVEYSTYIDYYNDKDQIHRLDGLARVFKDGSKGMYVVNGYCVTEEEFKQQYLKMLQKRRKEA